MNRRTALAGFVLLSVLALVLWRWHSGNSEREDLKAAKPVAGASLGMPAQHPHADPRTLERASIAGTVTDEGHAPVPRARVCVDASSNDLPPDLIRDPRCTTADDQGRYLISGLFAAEYTASAMAKPYRPADYHPDGDLKRTLFEVHAGEHRTGIDLVLNAGGVEMTGIVADITGGSIAHATVRASPSRWSSDGGAAIETDEQGRFSLWVKPGSVRVIAVADGYADGSEEGSAPGQLEILLTPESSLSGTVVDAKTGTPISGVAITAAAKAFMWSGVSDHTAITDVRGQFRVTRLSPDRYLVTARAGNAFGQADGSTRVGLGQHVDGVLVKMVSAVRVAGHVVIADAKPSVCKQSSLALNDTDHKRWVSAQLEPDGELHADGLLPGTYHVRVSCTGYKPLDKYPPIEIKDKDLVGLEWSVEVGAIVKGRVVTKSGDPVEDASVWAQSTGGAARDKTGWGSDSSKKDGSFQLDGLQAGSFKLEVRTDRGVGPKDGWKVEVAGGATVQRDLVLDDVGSITGTVSDPEGKPIGGIQIVARSSTGMWSFGANEVRSSDDGGFKIEGLRPGDYRVIAHHGWWSGELRKPGSNDDAKQGEKATVRAAQVATVRLVIESQAGSIKGAVTGADGKPVSDAFIVAARESDAAGSQRSSVSETRWSADERPVVTSTDGTFMITKLSPGGYTLRAFRKGGGEAIAEHVPIGGTAKLQIKPTGTIEGTVRRGGASPDEIRLELRDVKTGFSRSEQFFRTSGKFAIHDLPVGHFTVTASAEHGEKQADVDLAEGEHKTGLDLELDALVRLTGRVVELGSGTPVPGIMMAASLGKAGGGIMFSSSGDDQENISDEAGKFTINNAPRGALTIRGLPKSYPDGDYGFIQTVRNVEGTGDVEIGDIKVLKRRLKQGETAGELGIHFVQPAPGAAVDQGEYKVSWIDPAGAAAKTALKVGDLVITIDGIACTGADYMNGSMLMRAPPGTAIKLGLARGVTVTVVLAAP